MKTITKIRSANLQFSKKKKAIFQLSSCSKCCPLVRTHVRTRWLPLIDGLIDDSLLPHENNVYSIHTLLLAVSIKCLLRLRLLALSIVSNENLSWDFVVHQHRSLHRTQIVSSTR